MGGRTTSGGTPTLWSTLLLLSGPGFPCLCPLEGCIIHRDSFGPFFACCPQSHRREVELSKQAKTLGWRKVILGSQPSPPTLVALRFTASLPLIRYDRSCPARQAEMYIQASEATLASLAHHGVTAPSQVTAQNSPCQLVLPNTSCHRTLDLDDRTIVSIEQP